MPSGGCSYTFQKLQWNDNFFNSQGHESWLEKAGSALQFAKLMGKTVFN